MPVINVPFIIYLNEDTNFMSGYKTGDRLRKAYSGEEEWNFEDQAQLEGIVPGILDQIFARFQDENQPDDYVHRSLSCGDVIVTGESAFTVLTSGWGAVTLTMSDVLGVS
jgi:hypothetical protein